MSTINIKIVDIDEAGNILVKIASDRSRRPIDEYPAIGFPITVIDNVTPETFINSIRHQASNYVYVRDAIEAQLENINFESWVDYETSFEGTEYVDPFLTSQLVEGLTNPEVTL